MLMPSRTRVLITAMSCLLELVEYNYEVQFVILQKAGLPMNSEGIAELNLAISDLACHFGHVLKQIPEDKLYE